MLLGVNMISTSFIIICLAVTVYGVVVCCALSLIGISDLIKYLQQRARRGKK